MYIKDIDFSSAESFTNSLKQGIPILQSLACEVEQFERDHLRMRAPLDANINVHGTGFAGSIYMLGITTAWSMITYKMHQLDLSNSLVAATADIAYSRPVTTDFVADCRFTSEQQTTLLEWNQNKNLSLNLQTEIESAGKTCATITAKYVLLK